MNENDKFPLNIAHEVSIVAMLPQDEWDEHFVVMMLDFHEDDEPTPAWEGCAAAARRLAASLLNAADDVDAAMKAAGMVSTCECGGVIL